MNDDFWYCLRCFFFLFFTTLSVVIRLSNGFKLCTIEFLDKSLALTGGGINSLGLNDVRGWKI